MGPSDVAGMLALVSLVLGAGVARGGAGLAPMSGRDRLLHLGASGAPRLAPAATSGRQA